MLFPIAFHQKNKCFEAAVALAFSSADAPWSYKEAYLQCQYRLANNYVHKYQKVPVLFCCQVLIPELSFYIKAVFHYSTFHYPSDL